MNITPIDLHVHSIRSDGTLSPTELVSEAIQAGLSAFALTDHDTVEGIDEAIQATTGTSVTCISGIELSTDFEGSEVHMVGLFIDHHNAAFLSRLQEFQDFRINRNRKMVNNLTQEGFDISMEVLESTYPDSIITRAHMARYLFDTKQVKKMKTVFEKYIGNDCRLYVPREKISPFDAVDLIHSANGLAILAHPVLYHMNAARLDRLVGDLTIHGMDGIEAIYSTYSPGDERNMKALATKHHLLLSGGSDFHGSNKPMIHLGKGWGHLFVPSSFLDEMHHALGH